MTTYYYPVYVQTSWEEVNPTTSRNGSWGNGASRKWVPAPSGQPAAPKQQKRIPLMYPPWLDQLVERMEAERNKDSSSESSSSCSSPGMGEEDEKRKIWAERRRNRMLKRSGGI